MSDLQPHQQRVVDEKKELDEKISKLETFTQGELFSTLDKDDQTLLSQQLDVMNSYSEILGKRIERF